MSYMSVRTIYLHKDYFNFLCSMCVFTIEHMHLLQMKEPETDASWTQNLGWTLSTQTQLAVQEEQPPIAKSYLNSKSLGTWSFHTA